MGLTRYGIAYDLNISPYRLDVPYEGCTLTYVFSSELYKTNFYERFLENREKIGASLSKRFGFRIENDLLCDLKLYTMIEKRGFLVMKGEDKFVCQESITLDGAKLTKKSFSV